MRTLHIGRGRPRFRIGYCPEFPEWGIKRVGQAVWFNLGPVFIDVVWAQ